MESIIKTSECLSEESKPICDRKILSLEIEINKFSYARFLLQINLKENPLQYREDARWKVLIDCSRRQALKVFPCLT